MCLSLCICSLFQYLVPSHYSIIVTQQSRLKASFGNHGRHNKHLFFTLSHICLLEIIMYLFHLRMWYVAEVSPLGLIVNGIFVACFLMLLSFCTWFRDSWKVIIILRSQQGKCSFTMSINLFLCSTENSAPCVCFNSVRGVYHSALSCQSFGNLYNMRSQVETISL